MKTRAPPAARSAPSDVISSRAHAHVTDSVSRASSWKQTAISMRTALLSHSTPKKPKTTGLHHGSVLLLCLVRAYHFVAHEPGDGADLKRTGGT